MRIFYENIMKEKDHQFDKLASELKEMKNILQNRTEQANQNIKKMAAINMQLKQDYESCLSENTQLRKSIQQLSKDSVTLKNADNC